MIFQFKKPKFSKLEHPHQDLDNLMKALADGMNGAVYKDDKQLVMIASSKLWGEVDLIIVEISSVGER